jgi:motility quorum-sensing regulator/GCU-specific mRNA interferase toxin
MQPAPSSVQVLGMDRAAIVTVVTSHDAKFLLGMNTHADHRIWQDYTTRHLGGRLYLKLTVVDDVLVVSFKEL